MKVTREHKLSQYGLPVFVDESGQVVPYHEAVKSLRVELVESREVFGKRFNLSPRTIEAIEQGLRKPSAAMMNVIQDLLEEKETA